MPRTTRCGAVLAVLALVASVTFVGGVARGAGLGPGAATNAPPRRPTLEDSPGYYPAIDPESMAVATGRRSNAPRVAMRFEGGAASLEDLGRRVCRALHHRSIDSLLALCVRDDEFRVILWPEFPQSRPATGLTAEDAWPILYARLHGGSSGAVHDHGGHYYEFLRFERTDTVAVYRNFKLHNGLVLVARSDEGTIERFSWIRSVAERKGRFKIYSMYD